LRNVTPYLDLAPAMSSPGRPMTITS
jgi:hypothetical protein